jgi:hypothetical protein
VITYTIVNKHCASSGRCWEKNLLLSMRKMKETLQEVALAECISTLESRSIFARGVFSTPLPDLQVCSFAHLNDEEEQKS